MQNIKVTLTENDKAILAAYSSTLDGLAQYLGQGYEIVLHKLDDLEHSAIKVINGYHTGRTEGAPITDLALEMLERIAQNNQNDYICYHAHNKNDDPLWSTTIAIRGSEGKVIGLLCMNFYLETPFSKVFPGFGPVREEYPANRSENYVENVDEMITKAVTQATQEVDGMEGLLPSSRNFEIVRLLQMRGIFSIKNAVIRVASSMSISKNTVYLHLRSLKAACSKPK